MRRFVFENCTPGESLVTVAAPGRSPEHREVVVGQQEDLGEFRLAAGHTMRVRIVNSGGNPIEGAYFGVEFWQGYGTLDFSAHADQEGRVVWPSAPEDTVLCSIRAAGCSSLRNHPLEASDEEHVVTLLPELVIRGKVTDAKTGLPIPAFAIRRGFDHRSSNETRWVRTEEDHYRNGAYQFKIDQQTDIAYRLRVEAPGYYTKTSRPFEADEGSVKFDFSLEPGTDMVGTVLNAAGDPVSDARVGLARAASRACLNDGHFYRHQNQAEVVTTSESGEFTFPPQRDEPFLLIVTHDSGCAEVTREQFEKSSEIRLKPWGRIEGQVLLGDKPDVNRGVSFCPKLTDDQRTSVLSYSYGAKTDAQGRFELDRVIPGPGTISRVVITEFPRNAGRPSGRLRLACVSHSRGWQEPIDVESTKMTIVTIGGTGRPVVGRIELDRKPDAAIDWTTTHPVTIHRWDVDNDRAHEETFKCHGNIDEAGRFEIADVPPGSYRLTCCIWSAFSRNSATYPPTIGNAKHDFTVAPLADRRSDNPLDLGTIVVRVNPASK